MKIKSEKIQKGIYTIVILAMFVLTIFFYIKYREAQEIINTSNNSELPSIIAKVGRHIVLPTNEEPTLATVSEVEKLRDQKFFTRAENGDKILVYKKELKAILYRPRIDKIVEVAPVSIGEGEESGLTTPTESTNTRSQNITPTQTVNPINRTAEPLSIEVRNGTDRTNAAQQMISKVRTAQDNVNVQNTINASNNQYQRTIVIAVNMQKTDAIKQLATELGAIYEISLPEGEESSNADAIIIIGSDQVES